MGRSNQRAVSHLLASYVCVSPICKIFGIMFLLVCASCNIVWIQFITIIIIRLCIIINNTYICINKTSLELSMKFSCVLLYVKIFQMIQMLNLLLGIQIKDYSII